MTIRKDQSGLGTVAPDPHNPWVEAIIASDAFRSRINPDKPTALGTRFRHSDAGACSRKLSLVAAGVPKSDPMDTSGEWNVTLGTIVHELAQEAWAEMFGDKAEIEPKVATVGADGSGHIDLVHVAEDGTRTMVELKTIGGYGFKAALGMAAKGRPAEGPKAAHRVQAALNAVAADCDYATIVYLAKEALSTRFLNQVDEVGRFSAAWTYAREQFEPWASEEAERWAGIDALLDAGFLARRVVPGEMPADGEIVDVWKSRWEAPGDTGSIWSGMYCDYCSHRTVCDLAGPGRVPVDAVVSIGESA